MNQEPTANIGTTLLFENDRLRVWELVLEPGQSSGVHRHHHDFAFAYVTDENELEVRVSGEPPLATSAQDGYVSATEIGDGQDARLVHELVNVGTTRHRQILFELLGERARTEGHATTETNGRGRDEWAAEGAA
jgi:predicted metal-dependent enzyme (double-stranded beta helix superfamily)